MRSSNSFKQRSHHTCTRLLPSNNKNFNLKNPHSLSENIKSYPSDSKGTVKCSRYPCLLHGAARSQPLQHQDSRALCSQILRWAKAGGFGRGFGVVMMAKSFLRERWKVNVPGPCCWLSSVQGSSPSMRILRTKCWIWEGSGASCPTSAMGALHIPPLTL